MTFISGSNLVAANNFSVLGPREEADKFWDFEDHGQETAKANGTGGGAPRRRRAPDR